MVTERLTGGWSGALNLEAEAARQALPVNALVARIDVERMEADDPPNLTSAIRQWLLRGRSD